MQSTVKLREIRANRHEHRHMHVCSSVYTPHACAWMCADVSMCIYVCTACFLYAMSTTRAVQMMPRTHLSLSWRCRYTYYVFDVHRSMCEVRSSYTGQKWGLRLSLKTLLTTLRLESTCSSTEVTHVSCILELDTGPTWPFCDDRVPLYWRVAFDA